MKLLIDIGNTRIKWATVAGDEVVASGDIVHRGRGDADRTACIEQFLDQIDAEPDRVLAANVAGEAVGKSVVAAVRGRWNQSVDFAETQAESNGVRNAYADYRQMGVDRWLGILATCDRYARAACIVDAGTAITIDQVDGTGAHLGGVIVPGVDLMRRSLLSDTVEIGRLGGIGQDDAPAGGRTIFGRSTAAAIGGGSQSAICGLIEQCVDQLRDQYGDSVLVMTGGDVERIMPHLRVDADHRPLLVLEGLMIYSSR